MAREGALYEIPKSIERARVLDDSLLQAYQDSVKSKYNSEKARQTLLKFSSSNGGLYHFGIFVRLDFVLNPHKLFIKTA